MIITVCGAIEFKQWSELRLEPLIRHHLGIRNDRILSFKREVLSQLYARGPSKIKPRHVLKFSDSYLRLIDCEDLCAISQIFRHALQHRLRQVALRQAPFS